MALADASNAFRLFASLGGGNRPIYRSEPRSLNFFAADACGEKVIYEGQRSQEGCALDAKRIEWIGGGSIQGDRSSRVQLRRMHGAWRIFQPAWSRLFLAPGLGRWVKDGMETVSRLQPGFSNGDSSAVRKMAQSAEAWRGSQAEACLKEGEGGGLSPPAEAGGKEEPAERRLKKGVQLHFIELHLMAARFRGFAFF